MELIPTTAARQPRRLKNLHRGWCLILVAGIYSILGAACTSKTPVPVSQTPPNEARAAQRDTEEIKPSPEEIREAELWRGLLTKSSCNLLHGCPAATDLVALSSKVAARAAERLESDGSDRLWRFALAAALVRTKNPAVQRWQKDALAHKQWLIRAYAAAGLGRNDEKGFIKLAGDLLENERNPGARVGILWGLALAREKTARKRLSQAISTLRGGPDIRVELVALEAVRNLSLVEALPFVRQMLTHDNFFVVRDAVTTIQSLLDRRSIPLLIPLLSHERNLVRDEALATLKRLTSQRNKRTRVAFESWCAKNCDPTWPRPPGQDAQDR